MGRKKLQKLYHRAGFVRQIKEKMISPFGITKDAIFFPLFLSDARLHRQLYTVVRSQTLRGGGIIFENIIFGQKKSFLVFICNNYTCMFLFNDG
jgi:hypothetical protein